MNDPLIFITIISWDYLNLTTQAGLIVYGFFKMLLLIRQIWVKDTNCLFDTHTGHKVRMQHSHVASFCSPCCLSNQIHLTLSFVLFLLLVLLTSRICIVERIYISLYLTQIVCKYVAWREQVRLSIVQFIDEACALINGGNFHRFNILNQYFVNI